MDTRILRLFTDVMRLRSFSEVATRHGLAPSSVSRHIAALERELGVRLFQRSTRKLEPTEAAQLYYQRINGLIDELENAGQMAAEACEQPRGTLRITSSVVYGQMYLGPLLPRLQRACPDLSVELLLTDAYLDLIEERIDVAIRLGSLPDSTYVARRLASMTFHVCASQAYLDRHGTPQRPADIPNHECLIFPRHGFNDNWLFRDDRGNIEEIPITGHYLITHSQTTRDCAIAGMGLALLPDWLVDPDIEAGRLIKVLEDYEATATDFDTAVSLLYPSREQLPLKTRIFIDLLLEQTRQGEKPATMGT